MERDRFEPVNEGGFVRPKGAIRTCLSTSINFVKRVFPRELWYKYRYQFNDYQLYFFQVAHGTHLRTAKTLCRRNFRSRHLCSLRTKPLPRVARKLPERHDPGLPRIPLPKNPNPIPQKVLSFRCSESYPVSGMLRVERPDGADSFLEFVAREVAAIPDLRTVVVDRTERIVQQGCDFGSVADSKPDNSAN